MPATAAASRGAPPKAASIRTGESAWLNARRTQGNPPKGVLERAHSPTTQPMGTSRYAAAPSPRASRRRWSGPTTASIAAI